MKQSFRVLVLGGYGNFGAVIAKKLSQIPKVELIIAGRNEEKAREAAEKLSAAYEVIDIFKDPLTDTFNRLNLDLIINTVGPFQNQDYTVVKSALAAEVNYLDLADAREFVCNISQFDQEAKEKNIFICSGASSVPGLSSAVINQYKPLFEKMNAFDIGISSSEKVPGISTLSAVLSYCGQPYKIWKQKRWQQVYGFGNLHLHLFYNLPKKRWLFNCNVPDLSLLPEAYPEVANVNFSAGVGLSIVQFVSWLLGYLVRFRLLKNLPSKAPFLHKAAKLLESFGNGTSAMYVTIKGIDQEQQPQELTWEIIAYDNDGPTIPCLAAVAITRKFCFGAFKEKGAFSSMNVLSLDEYLTELGGLNIHTFIHKKNQTNKI